MKIGKMFGVGLAACLVSTVFAAPPPGKVSIHEGAVETYDSDGVRMGRLSRNYLDLGSVGGGGAGGDGQIYLLDGATGNTIIRLDAVTGDATLGGLGADGDLIVKDSLGIPTLSVDGDTGTISNILSGNGLVKAWAEISADGSIVRCWRCNTDTAQTRSISTGTYEVDFTPLGNDISTRPFVVSITRNEPIVPSGRMVNGAIRNLDPSSIWVGIYDSVGNTFNSAFTVVIY